MNVAQKTLSIRIIQNQMNDRVEGKEQMMEEEEQFEIIAEDHSSSPDDIYFDTVVGALQDVIVDEEFEGIQGQFMNKYYSLFEDNQENKFQYTEVFQLYQKEVEQYVQKRLGQRVPQFNMPTFLGLLQHRTDQIDEFILDMLESFTQFSAFKKLMLQHRDYLKNEVNLKNLSVKSNRLS